MKLTDDILKALQHCVEGFGSTTALANKADISIKTLSKYLSRKTNFMKEETWDKLYPFLQPYLSREKDHGEEKKHHYKELTSDQKILIDAFSELPEAWQKRKLMQMVKLAYKVTERKNRDN